MFSGPGPGFAATKRTNQEAKYTKQDVVTKCHCTLRNGGRSALFLFWSNYVELCVVTFTRIFADRAGKRGVTACHRQILLGRTGHAARDRRTASCAKRSRGAAESKADRICRAKSCQAAQTRLLRQPKNVGMSETRISGLWFCVFWGPWRALREVRSCFPQCGKETILRQAPEATK